ncbi:N-acetyltransferase [Vibrio sp. MACH09]|uniref:GNAT family N-acetyltransferase n=1 Tax=Vibrio sp. MACH09 TaxID=3025122 RepID=UPI002793CAEC|nr:GNAT family N-acetyltransferase [Vibrio sp. MACH09]GLO60989.1 N-acetyltransferase [Vibrio sp. MACH09]
MSSIQIRAANLSDLEVLNTLMYQLHQFHHDEQPEHIKTAEEIEQEKSIARYLDNPECLVYVAIDGDNIVGFITGQFCELISPISKPVTMGSVDELYVLAKYRHMSVATLLMDKLQNMFDDFGVKRVFVEVWHFNQAAITFYKKNGFSHHIHWLCKDL